MFVKPNIYKVTCTDGSYVYAIRNEHGITLIDTHFPGKGEEIAAELKEAMGVSRKHAIPVLEHFDDTGVTRRVGDARELAS